MPTKRVAVAEGAAAHVRSTGRRFLGDYADDLRQGLVTLPGFTPADWGASANPALGTDVRMPDGTVRHFDAVQDAAGNYLSPKIFISDSFPGGYAAAMPGTEEYAHYSNVMTRDNNQGIIQVAALVGGAAVAGAFLNTAAAAATSTQAAAQAGELTEITLPASAVYLPTSVAPTILSESASLLTMPVFDAGAIAPLADQLVNAVKTPAVQDAIAKGAIPPIPDGVGSSAFTKWATSTGIKYLEQQLGRALTPSEQANVEAQMAAEIRRLQGGLASNPANAGFMGSTDWGAILPWALGGGAILIGVLAS